MAGDEFEAPRLSDGGEQENAFHPSEAFSDADAHPSAEGEVRKFRALVGFAPTFGPEFIGRGEPARVAMDHPGAHH